MVSIFGVELESKSYRKEIMGALSKKVDGTFLLHR